MVHRLVAGVVLIAATVLAGGPAHAQAGRPAGFGWSGAYVGAHVGWMWSDLHYVEPDDPQFAFDADLDGASAGVLAGYNRQFDRLVLGAELEAGVTDASFGSKDGGGNGYAAFDLWGTARLRGRAGLAIDRTLLFVAGGLAVGQLTVDDTDPEFGKDEGTHVGWTIGGGVEHAMTDSLLLRLEYLYDDFGSESHSVASPAGSPFFPAYEAETDLTAHTIRAAAVWRF